MDNSLLEVGDGRFIVEHNGEIYNYKSFKEQT